MRRFWGLLVVLSLLVCGWMIFFWAPIDSSMGMVQKIMYIHVPTIWNAFLAFFIAFVCSIAYLVKRKEVFDIVACCSAEIGVVFCGTTLVVASIWAKPTWNTYWTWDARLTTTLILFLIFVGYLLLRKFTHYGEQQARLSAVVAIVGFLDVPLIHLSVTWWRTLHQPSTVFSRQGSVIDTPLLVMLIISVLTCTFLFAFLLSVRIDLEKKTRTYLKELANIDK
ncbi:MAG: cytochrome c biogenesis protein CcsA [Proteobacteria bacterium]|nr:cytochrome c biogenesis protein CcsA [Pseudomonadota bacterium]